MSATVSAIAEKFSPLVKLERGDPGTVIKGLAAGPKAETHHIVFVTDPKHLAQAKSGKSLNWVVHAKLLPLVPTEVAVLFSSTSVHLAMAMIGREFFLPTLSREPFDSEPIHPTALIHPSAEIGDGVTIGPYSTIGARVKIGRDCIVGANTTLEPEVVVGDRTHIFSQVYIANRTVIGQDCEIKPQTSIGTEGFGFAHDPAGNHYRIPHYGKTIIGDRVRIGAGVQVDRGTFEDTHIGAGTIIDNHCHFGHNFRCGKNCIFVGATVVAGSVTIGDNCVFGGRTIIAGHLKIADNCQFAGLSAVTASIDKPGQYGGYPPQPLKDALKSQASIASLPRLRKNVSRIMKHLGLSQEES